MKQLFEFIRDRVLTVPEVKTVDLWNNQTGHVNSEKDGNAILYPAVYIEFLVQDVKNYALDIRDVEMIVRVRYAVESYEYSKLNDLDFIYAVDKALTGFAGTAQDPVNFSALQLTFDELDTEIDTVDETYRDYWTVYRDTSAYKGQLAGPVMPQVKVTATIIK